MAQPQASAFLPPGFRNNRAGASKLLHGRILMFTIGAGRALAATCAKSLSYQPAHSIVICVRASDLLKKHGLNPDYYTDAEGGLYALKAKEAIHLQPDEMMVLRSGRKPETKECGSDGLFSHGTSKKAAEALLQETIEFGKIEAPRSALTGQAYGRGQYHTNQKHESDKYAARAVEREQSEPATIYLALDSKDAPTTFIDHDDIDVEEIERLESTVGGEPELRRMKHSYLQDQRIWLIATPAAYKSERIYTYVVDDIKK